MLRLEAKLSSLQESMRGRLNTHTLGLPIQDTPLGDVISNTTCHGMRWKYPVSLGL